MSGLNIRSRGKRWLKRSLVASRTLRLASRWQPPRVAILMYHSVMAEPQRHAETLGDIVRSAAAFRRQMEVLARHYDPVSLDDVLLFVEGRKQLPARPVVVTFDDGYADNAEVAAPILTELGIPGVFYLTVACVDNATPPWVARLRYAFSTTQAKYWSGLNGSKLPLTDGPKRQQALTISSEHCARLTGEMQERFVGSIEHEFGTGVMPDHRRLMMNWDQARQLVRQRHIVGSHTLCHPNMAHVATDVELAREFQESKRRLEQELGGPVHHFSYPCPILQPHWSLRTVQICREAGYRTAVTTNPGAVRPGDDPFTLHRVRPTADMDGLRWNLECSFLGRSV